MTQSAKSSNPSNWQARTLVLGALIGAVTGLVGAAIIIQSANKKAISPSMSAGDGVKVGLSVLSVLRMLADL